MVRCEIAMLLLHRIVDNRHPRGETAVDILHLFPGMNRWARVVPSPAGASPRLAPSSHPRLAVSMLSQSTGIPLLSLPTPCLSAGDLPFPRRVIPKVLFSCFPPSFLPFFLPSSRHPSIECPFPAPYTTGLCGRSGENRP